MGRRFLTNEARPEQDQFGGVHQYIEAIGPTEKALRDLARLMEQWVEEG